ncbi:cysteine desulfurase family protein [Marinilabilia salmonicolor]|uniref:cysteine desulfurase family protein n=1 Tax=Marinilabilia salmonicolor TaxID=989 RepID=UPI00029B139B|nr:cysteine desulfurase family protein [Marinilabilia salmonicolor]
MNTPIYLDYNATTPVDREVITEMLHFVQTHFGNPSSSYKMGQENKEAIAKARQQVADTICAIPEEIVFTSCATESNNLAIRGVALAHQDKGKHIITSQIEHPSVLEVCRYLERTGFEVTYLSVNSEGVVDSHDVSRAIRPDTILITIMHANNEVGTIQPIREIAAVAKEHNVIFHADAAQSVGKVNIDVDLLGVDLLTIAGHKVYAPKGIGALYVRKGVKVENLMVGGGQENGLRPGTENVPYIVALGKACEIAVRDFEQNTSTMLSAKKRLWNGLKTKFGGKVSVNANHAETLPNTLSVVFSGIDAHTLTASLGDQVLVSAGSACHANSVETSSVLKAMNIEPGKAASTVRISTGKQTTPEEVDKAVEIITGVVSRLLMLK